MKSLTIRIIIFIVVAIVFAAWAMAMTASGPDSLKFYLIYIPLLIFLITEIYLISKIRTSSKNKKVFKLLSFLISPIILFIFLFFSFGESKNKICISGDCENGYGEALYIRSERTTKTNGEYIDYNPEFLGRNWYNNIVWYDGNPIREYYVGNFKNGKFHGEGRLAYNIMRISNSGPGCYVVGGEWENGWLLWDKSTRYNGWVKMSDEELDKFLKELQLSNNPLSYENDFYYHMN
tara:strand:+ start:114 stop:818 length:705 start_codon:yes stop_codon:yes gene_type:complete